MKTKQQMQARMREIAARSKTLATKVEALTPEETAEISTLAQELDAIKARLTALATGEQVVEDEAAATEAEDKPEEPAPTALTETIRAEVVKHIARISGGDKVGASARTGGFQSFASRSGGKDSFLGAVHAAAFGVHDPRLKAMESKDGPSGGYAVPPDYDSRITRTIDEMPFSLRSLCDVRPTSSNRVIVPVDSKRPWQTGGVAVTPLAEAATHVRSDPKIGRLDMELHKLAAFVELTDELMTDAPQIESLLTTKFGEALVYALNEYIVSGNGTNVPKGILNGGSVVTVAKESSQSAAGIIAENVVKMFSRLHPMAQRGAVWLVSPDAYAVLPLMVIGTQPVFVPPSGLEAAPFGTLLGRPVYISEEASALGTLNDIMLMDLKSYLLVERKAGDVSSSNHFLFDRDTNCVKIVARYGGASKWTAPLPAKNGASPSQSNIVNLAARP